MGCTPHTAPDEAHHRKEDIISAAEHLFETHGYDATRMEAVAAAAGVAKGSIYNYFRSKQALFLEVFFRAIAGDEAEVQRMFDRPVGATQKLESLLDYFAQRMKHYIMIGGLVLEFWATAAREDRQGELARTFQQMYGQWRGRIAEVIAQGISQGEFDPHADPEAGACLIMAVMDGIVVQSIFDVGLRAKAEPMAGVKAGIVRSLRGRAR